jgi:hypothetical protein
MPTFEVTVVERWMHMSTVNVEAETKEEAIEAAFTAVEEDNRELTDEEYFRTLYFSEYEAWDVEEVKLKNEEEE